MPLFPLDTRVLFVTGKGGVGKTSVACATALALAEEGRRVLLISTDPASNLDEVLGVPLGPAPRPVPGVPGLSALNVDPQAAAAAYRERVVGPYRGVLPAVAVSSMEEQLSGACTVEIAAFDEFTALLGDPTATAEFDHVVFDTAPTGHTLRLLELPAAWSSFIDTNVGGTSCLGPLSGLAAQRTLYASARDALRDPAYTTLLLVARPDRASLAEAERTRAELADLGIGHQRLVVNGIFAASDASDPVAVAFARRARDAMRRVPPGLARLPRSELPLLPFGLVGIEALRALGRTDPASGPAADAGEQAPPQTSSFGALVDELSARRRGVVLTMGKGGVGKTFVAARLAEALAARGLAVHLTTTDPAAHVAAAVRPMPGLEVSRIDPAAETAAYTAEVMATAGADLDESGRALLAEDLRSPCTEEIAVFRAFARTVEHGEDRLVVIDTAPTGHTLLLLDAAEAYHREVLKRPSGSPDAVRRLLPRLRDPAFTTVLLVTLPEATPVHEAAQLEADLARAGIRPAAWLVNQSLTPLGVSDPVLRRRRAAEARYIREVQSRTARCVLLPWEMAMTDDVEPIRIEDATPADRADVLALLHEAGLGAEGVPDDLRGFLVARDADGIVGVAGIEAYGESALLRSVAVAPSQRGTGIGGRLVDAALGRAMQDGARDVVLLTHDADGWFRRFGFERIRRDEAPAGVRASVQFTGACPDSAIVMKRTAPLRVLVLCTGNSARSQVAEALLATLGGGRIEAASAGTRPAERVNPGAVEVLARHGIAWTGRAPTDIDAVADERWDVVITVCDNAREACPVLPGAPVLVHWGLPDPAHVVGEAERHAAFEATWVALERRIRAMLDLPLESMTDAERQRALRALAVAD